MIHGRENEVNVGHRQRRRRRSVVPVELHVVAQYGHFEVEATIQLAVNRTGCCGVPGSQSTPQQGRSVGQMVLDQQSEGLLTLT